MIHDSRSADSFSLESQEEPFKIVTIYDSSTGSVEAARVSAVVARELGDDVEIDRSSWNVEALDQSTVRDIAAGEAARADIILIALSTELPSDGFKQWITQWECKRQTTGGLLALIPADTHSFSLEELLYEAAVSANMDFLCGKQPRY